MVTLDECVAFFKNTEGFARLMSGLFDMYVRYERCFGAVRLTRPTPVEEKALSDFFKRDYYDQALIRISLADFERQVQKTFSENIRLDALLEAYNKRPIIRRSGSRVTVSAFSAFVENDILPKYIETEAELWLREVIAHTRRSYRKWVDLYTGNQKKVVQMLESVCNVLNNLPCLEGKLENLSDFAKKHGSDAHSFDINSELGPLFLRALARRFDSPTPSSAEESSALYYKAGLLTEGILNPVAVRGITAWRGEEPDGVCELYNKLNEPHILTLEQLSRFARAEAVNGKAYIVENMHVFSALNEQTRSQRCTLICVNNSLNAAVLCLLDLLHLSDVEIYFSGNMDYEGLVLADKLYLRYPRRFKPWRYGKDDYERIIKDNEFYLPDHKVDQGLHNEDLASLLSYMRKKGKTAPQLALLKALAEDIKG